VLALDYDGAIATSGILEPSVREAISEAREREMAFLLVTGHILADHERLLGNDLRFFDAMVVYVHYADNCG
jgi:hydroxymethylpyrimidine pyrophosphatase-like HAD family hydrolase